MPNTANEMWSYLALYELLAEGKTTNIFPSEAKAKAAFEAAFTMIEGATSMTDESDDRQYQEVYQRALAEASNLLDADTIDVEHSRADIAGRPHEFSDQVLAAELRVIAGQQLSGTRTGKLRTHFDRISAELRRRGLNNNGAPL